MLCLIAVGLTIKAWRKTLTMHTAWANTKQNRLHNRSIQNGTICNRRNICPVLECGGKWIAIIHFSSLVLDWVGLDLFNEDTCPTEHISRPTQVGSLTVYNLWQFISDGRIRLLVKIPLCKSRESSHRGLQIISSVVFIPNYLQSCTFQEHVVNGQRLSTMMASGGRSSGQDMGLRSLGMTNSKQGDDNLLSSG